MNLNKGKTLKSEYVRKYYDTFLSEYENEYSYHRWFAGPVEKVHFSQTRFTLLPFLRNISGNILEIGGGDGIWTKHYISSAEHLVFLDISQEMIKRAQQRLAESSTKIKYMNVDFLQNNLESNSFDNIISIRNLEYFSDKKAFLNETYRLLKKNGNLLLITKNPTYSSNVSNRKLLHTSQINIDDLLQMLISCGYKIKCIHPAIFGKLFRFSLFRGLFSLIHRIINLLPIGMTRSKTLSYLSESFLVYAEK